MPMGPGKYDEACTEARNATGGQAVALIVVWGDHGSGFSVQVAEGVNAAEIALRLPSLLRTMADEIEKENAIEPSLRRN